MVRRAGDVNALALVLAMYHHVIRGPDTVHECLSTAVELADVARAAGDRQMELEAHSWAIDHLLELGRADSAARELRCLDEAAADVEDRFSRWLLTVARARDAHLKGRLDAFEALAYQGFQLAFESQNRAAAQIFGGQMVALRREQDRLSEVIEGVEALTAQFPGIATWRSTLAYMYAELGRPQDAREQLERLAHARFTDIPRDGLWLSSLATLCEVVAFVEDPSRAALLYELLTPYADRVVVIMGVLCLGAMSRHLGLLAMTMSRFEEADAHFRDALEMHEKLGSALWSAHTKHNQAQLLLRQGGADPRERPGALLHEVLSVAERHGLDALANRARELMRSLPREQGGDVKLPFTNVV
jgi:tetratricopeptide (TPR) repeat protein